MTSLIMTVMMVVLMVLRVPISFSMGLSALVALLMIDRDLIALPQYMATGVQISALLAVPYYILGGNLMNSMNLTRRIFNFAMSLVGHLKGGLAQVVVVSSMIFAGISGSAVADCAGLGVIQIKAMTEHGYRKHFAAAITLAASVIAPIIPPSINFVIYAVIAEVSIGKLFLAGYGSGTFIGLSLMIINYYRASRGIEPCPTVPRSSLKEVGRSFYNNFLAIITPLIILSGMLFGIATPTEAGIIAVVYAFLVGLIYRESSFHDFLEGVRGSFKATCTIMVIIGVSTVMGWVYTYDAIPQKVASLMLGISHNKYVVLTLINIFILIMGCLMEPAPILIICTPILLPVIKQIGIDPVHFGVIFCYNITIGITTPPVGMGLYVMMNIANMSFSEIVKEVFPFYIPLIFSLFVITFVPQLSLWLPGLFF